MLEVLIVDDDQIVVFIQKKMISNHEIASNPICFNNAVSALNYLNDQQQLQNKKEFLIFLDINMPNMNGWDFLDCLENHEEKSNYHVVMVTSSINKEDKEEAKKYYENAKNIAPDLKHSALEKIMD